MIGSVDKPGRVLIIKPSSLGDVATALPVLRGLRRTFPDAHVAWLLTGACAPLVAHDSDLDEVILFKRRLLGRAWRSLSGAGELAGLLRKLHRARFDWVLDLQGLLRSGLLSAATGAGVRAGFAGAREGASVFYTHRIRTGRQHTVDRNIDLACRLGIDARPADMNLQVADEGRDRAESLLGDAGLEVGGFLVCVPPTRWATKVYPVRRWRTVIARLAETVPVVLLGSAETREVSLCGAVAEDMPSSVVNLAGKTGVSEMVALIAASCGVVCSDSAAQYIGPAVGVDVVTLVGPTRPRRTGPYLRGKTIVADIPCRGCLKRSCRHATCMDSIDPDLVVEAAMDMLDKGVATCRFDTSQKR